MKIVVFSVNPVFPDLVTGGASKHLFNICRALGQYGHKVELLCARAEQPHPDFLWAENVLVSQCLPFHMPFPQPYAISPADLGLIAEQVGRHLETADRFYIHDGEFLLPDVYAEIPTVVSFRDNVYPESVLGSFIDKADEIICVSPYSAEVVNSTAGRFFPGLQDRIHLVNNGIDFELFKPVDTEQLANKLGVNPQVDTILLHPHRPEPGKGLPETIRVVEQLVHRFGKRQIKVLVPEWIETMVAADEESFYHQMNHLMDDLGVRENFTFIPWLSQAEMPALYSLGKATLCLGNFVEAFGNVAYESLACGTPSVVARVGVHRTMLPDNLIDKVDFGDIDEAAVCVLSILEEGKINQSEVLAYLKEQMNFQQQVTRYSEVITQCEKRPKLCFSVPHYSNDQPYTLAPWCYLVDERIYHDFHQGYETDLALTTLLAETPMISKSGAKARGITEDQWETWMARTWLVPLQGNLLSADQVER